MSALHYQQSASKIREGRESHFGGDDARRYFERVNHDVTIERSREQSFAGRVESERIDPSGVEDESRLRYFLRRDVDSMQILATSHRNEAMKRGSTHKRIFPLDSPTAKVIPSFANRKQETADRFFSITPTFFRPSKEKRWTFPSSAPTAMICDFSEAAMAVGEIVRGTEWVAVRVDGSIEDSAVLVRR